MRIKVLGPMEVVVEGEPLALGGPQQRLVLAILVSRIGVAVTTDSLIDSLWSDEEPPNRARKTVQVYVANLRKLLGGDDAPVQSAPGGYVLRSESVTVDAIDFETALGTVGSDEDRDARATVERLSAALALWNGQPYADLSDAPTLTVEIARLNELRLVALERRLEAALASGHHRGVLSEVDALTTEHPYRERFTALQMLALYRSGRQAEALRAYQRLRLVLADELGIEPSPEAQALEQAILNQDPSLDLDAGSDGSASLAHEPTDDRRSIRGYELRERLGDGDGDGDGSTLWRAYQPATEREVMLRVFGADVANDPAFVKRFERDTQRVAQLEHPHLVSIYDYWRDPEGAYVVMPVLRGGTLAHSLRRGRWKLPPALRMLDQVGAALATLHRHDLHHGGVGPEAVFLDTDGNAYLADVGTSRPRDATSGSDVDDLFDLLAQTVHAGDVPADLAAVVASEGHGRVEDLLRAVRQATGSDAVGVASDLESDRPRATNPYKGLRAFQEADATDFFGRDVLVGRLVETVAERPFTAVVGSSGSGKSSVVKAGLIPSVRDGVLGGDWVVAEMYPGSFPFEEFEAALLKVGVDRPDGLVADLTADDRGMLRVIKRVLPDDGTGLLLVIDQFEELFSLTPDDETRRLFLDNLVTLGQDARSRVRIVATLRADFFDRPLDHPAFGELVRQGLVTVAMPDQDSLALMVSQPARQAGLDLEPGLVTVVVRDVMEQPGGLPLMQYALTELADGSDGRTLTVAGYHESGGVLGALGQRAEEIYQGLQPSARAVAERIFLRLVTVDEHADDTRRRIRRTELSTLGLDRSAVESVLQEFGSFRLLSFDHDPTTRGPTVEVAHEALIREWPRLRSWVDDQRENLLLERRLREAVIDWEASDRDPGYLLRGGRLEQFESWAAAVPTHVTDPERSLIEQSRAAADAEAAGERRRTRRLRRLVAVVGVALVAALVAGAFALRQRDRAEDAADDAELATLISASAAQSAEDPEVSLLLALEAHRRQPSVETESALLNALASSNRVASLGPLVDPSSPCDIRTIGPNGGTETAIVDGRLTRRDLHSGEVTDHGASPTPCGRWIGDTDTGQVVVEAEDGLGHWFGPADGPLAPVESSRPTFLVAGPVESNHRHLYVTPGEPFVSPDIVMLRDDRTGEAIGPQIAPASGLLLAGTSTSGGELFAAALAIIDGPNDGGQTFVVDGDSGEQVVRIDSELPAEVLAFDEADGRLVGWMPDGTIRTFDLETGDEVDELRVAATTTSRRLELHIRDDGIVVAVSESQIELLDRAIGPIRNPVDLRNTRVAQVRSDGTVVVSTPDGTISVVDPESNSLIEKAWDADPFAHPAFKAGRAATLENPGDLPVVVDLDTGDRSLHELVTDTGARFDVAKIYPEPDGVLAFSWDNVVARWEEGELVDELDLGGEHLVRTQFGDLISVLSVQPGGKWVVDLITTEPNARSLFRVDAPDAVETHPSAAGGLHIINEDGTLETYDASGELFGEIATGLEGAGFIAVDPTTGMVALAAAPRDLVFVDPATGDVQRVPEVGAISTLGFGRDGEILTLTYRDGTVRLWDVDRAEYAGQVWNGAGQASTASPSWYDEDTGTMWTASSGKYLGILLEPERWVERACEIVSRELTQEEWDRFAPGDEPGRSACP